MPRYVILEHDHPLLHWDLMLESGDVLRTWRLLEQPEAGKTVAAEALGEHRRLYLDYEGPVSGGRGTVKRWDAGDFTAVSDQTDGVEVHLNGRRLKGTAALVRCDQEQWSFQLSE